jgi:hypothetical protein
MTDQRMSRAEEVSALLDWHGETYHRAVAAIDILSDETANERCKADAQKELLACDGERARWTHVAAHGALAHWLTVLPSQSSHTGEVSP